MSYAAPATTGLAALCWVVLVVAAAFSSVLAFGVWTDEGSGLNSDSMTYYLILMPTHRVPWSSRRHLRRAVGSVDGLTSDS